MNLNSQRMFGRTYLTKLKTWLNKCSFMSLKNVLPVLTASSMTGLRRRFTFSHRLVKINLRRNLWNYLNLKLKKNYSRLHWVISQITLSPKEKTNNWPRFSNNWTQMQMDFYRERNLLQGIKIFCKRLPNKKFKK